ncbi:MAG TPA: DUF6266 family protein [Chitinophagaceae bacterium]|jgi:hypothetical protein
MGKLINGINGPIVGKVGKVHGSSRNGVSYVKGPYKDRTEKITAKEAGNRVRFAQAQSWLKPLLAFVREGFRDPEKKGVGFIEAKSYLMKNALQGVAPDISIDPALMLVSRGTLPLSNDITAEKPGIDTLQFTWDTAAVEGGSLYDQVMLLAYDIEHGVAAYNMTGQFRSTGADTLKIFGEKGSTWHLYLAFSAADRKSQSNSVYFGAIAM